jgi:transcriptional regulator with XRE-family HTH domain
LYKHGFLSITFSNFFSSIILTLSTTNKIHIVVDYNQRYDQAQYCIITTATGILEQLGENIRLARLRRKLSATQVADRAGIDQSTLWNVEKGNPQVTMAAYVQVLFVLGLPEDLLKVATDDALGRAPAGRSAGRKKTSPKTKKIKHEHRFICGLGRNQQRACVGGQADDCPHQRTPGDQF